MPLLILSGIAGSLSLDFRVGACSILLAKEFQNLSRFTYCWIWITEFS